MGDLGNGLQIGNIVAWVTNAFDVDGLGLVVDGRSNVFRLVAVYKLGLYPKPGQKHFELVICAAVQVGRRDNIVAGVCERVDGHKLGALARGSGQGSDAAFEGGNALFEYVHRRLSAR